MAIYGVMIEKTGPYERQYKNVYYVEAATLEGALTIGESLVSVERNFFGDSTTINSLRTWVPGASPPQFVTKSVQLPGLVNSVNAIPDHQTLRVTLSAAVGFGGYKDYRVCVSDTLLLGDTWTATYITSLDAGITALQAVLPSLRTRQGGVFQSAGYFLQVKSRQLKNRWYNRTA